MDSTTACLGLKILGECSYDPSSPPIYFAIGHLLSVVALIFAFSQLTRPIYRSRIKLRANYKILKMLAGAAILSIFIAAILPLIPGTALPLLGYPIFWELLSAAIFVGAGVYFIAILNKPALFSERKAMGYLNEMFRVISRGNEESLYDLAEEIRPSISSVVSESRYMANWGRAGKAHKYIKEPPEVAKISNRILAVWSDTKFCRALVCRAPGSARAIIRTFQEDPSYCVGRNLCGEIINQATVCEDSILNRENEFSGLGLLVNSSREIFGNWEFVSSSYAPLRAWRHREVIVEAWQVKKYIECAKAAFSGYIDSKDFDRRPGALYTAFEELSSIAMNQVFAVNSSSERDITKTTQWQVLFEISYGLKDILRVALSVDSYPEYEFDEQSYDTFTDSSVFGILAIGVYDYLEILAMIESRDETMRSFSIGLWLEIFGRRADRLGNHAEVAKRLLIHIKTKIDENLDRDQRWYPAMTRLILLVCGLSAPEADDDRIEATFHRGFLDKLKRNFIPLYNKEKKFALAMLPDSVEYDHNKKTLIRVSRRGGQTELSLV